jgi:hypothetical protein
VLIVTAPANIYVYITPLRFSLGGRPRSERSFER